jgi:hypothetical protein
MPRLPSFDWSPATESTDVAAGIRSVSSRRFARDRNCRYFQPPASTDHILPRPPVNPVAGIPALAPKKRFAPDCRAGGALRHGTCIVMDVSEKDSQAWTGSVNSVGRPAKVASVDRRSPLCRCDVGTERSGRCRGWNHGATGYGYRKRTRVRVACGVTIRPCGVGILSSHGHFGRSIDGSFLAPVVLQPVREDPLRRGHPTRGSGLPAATLTFLIVGPVRLSALADSTSSATRRRRAVVTRAASVPELPAGVPGGWTRRTRPDPRTRLQQV